MKTNLSLLIPALTVAALALTGCGDSGAPTSPATAFPPAVPAGWQVYQNSTWKYSVAYPPSWFQPPSADASNHYFSNENVATHGANSPAGFDLAIHAGTACLSTGGENSATEPVISSGQVTVAGTKVTRYLDQFKPPPALGSPAGWNLIANVQVGATCLHVASFSTVRAVTDALLPNFDLVLASIRPA